MLKFDRYFIISKNKLEMCHSIKIKPNQFSILFKYLLFIFLCILIVKMSNKIEIFKLKY